MGMFDDLKCKYPLPKPGANDLSYQTKDTPAQFMDLYEIREDGTLWHEDYDVEDHSEATKWQKANPGKELPEELQGLGGICGIMTRVNKRWVQVSEFTGEIRFYDFLKPDGWIEWSAYLVKGKVNQINLIEDRPPNVQSS